MSGRESILEAAEEVFAEKGFAGSSMSGIAEKAGVAKSLIYHHFQSKEDLWREVIHQRFSMAALIDKLNSVISEQSTGSLMEIAAGPDGFFQFLRRHPRMVRMMTWLNLEGSGPAPAPEDLHAEVVDTISSMVTDGKLRSDLDPAVLPVLYMSVCFHWFAAKWKFRSWFDPSLSDDELDRRFIDGALDIILKGILPADA
jgi:TetR/AcrR family transcriptional regulator